MPRLVLRNVKIKKPPTSTREKVVLVKRPASKIVDGLHEAKAKSLGYSTSAKTHVVNVIKPPKTIQQKAADKEPDIAGRIAARMRYRENAGVVMDSCLHNLEELESFATKLVVTLPNGKVKEVMAFTITGIGGPLNISGATVTRWIRRGMLPEPYLATGRGNVYHIEEVRVMVRLIGNHQFEFRQYRDDHVALKKNVFRAIDDVRRGLFPEQ